MTRPAASKLMLGLLSLNMAALFAIVALLLSRGDVLPAAWAQMPSPDRQQDLIVMPGQLANNVWGCYVLDKRTQTLCVYQYTPGDRMLRLQAARGIEQDLELRSFNTSPDPASVADLIRKERSLKSGQPTTGPAPETERK